MRTFRSVRCLHYATLFRSSLLLLASVSEKILIFTMQLKYLCIFCICIIYGCTYMDHLSKIMTLNLVFLSFQSLFSWWDSLSSLSEFIPLSRSDFSFSRHALFQSFCTGISPLVFFFQVRHRNKLVLLRHPTVVVMVLVVVPAAVVVVSPQSTKDPKKKS